MKNKKQTIKFDKKDIQLLAIIALLIIAITFIFSVATMPVFAEEYTEIDVKNFDNTNVLDDLKSAENFDITQYPIDKKMDTFIVQNVVEYCYSYDETKRSNYAVYLYLYNPSLIEIDTTSYDNKVQLAIGYDNDSKPNNYEKFSLKFCSVSNDADHKFLFYKFKIVDKRSTSDNKTIAERVNSNARRYDISGIELLTNGSVLSTDYPVNKTYTFSGYAAGYGPDESILESTLQCQAEQLNTLKLNVEHTFYRTLTSNKGADYQNQIDTVYFSVPNKYFENYGKLQRIKAEWYEYKTKPIVVTSNKDFYDKALPYIGEYIGADYKKDIGYTLSSSMYAWTYNRYYLIKPEDISNTGICGTLYYLFPCEDIEKYDPYSDYTKSGILSNDLYNYILEYNTTYENGKLPIKHGFISADLFEADIDDTRKVDNAAGKIQQGYCYYDFDADLDVKYLGTWQQSNPNFIDNVNKWGLFDTLFGNIPKEEAINISPIVTFDYNDLLMGAEDLVNKYYINYNDVTKFKDYARAAQIKGEKVILFRFATSDYYNPQLFLQKGTSGAEKLGQAYLAQESVFFNFDIIQLTFRNNDKYTVIPVVSSPIDIVDGITPPVNIKPDNKNIFTIILTVTLLLIAVIIIVNIVIWLINTLANQPAKTNTKGKSNKSEYHYKGKRKE